MINDDDFLPIEIGQWSSSDIRKLKEREAMEASDHLLSYDLFRLEKVTQNNIDDVNKSNKMVGNKKINTVAERMKCVKNDNSNVAVISNAKQNNRFINKFKNGKLLAIKINKQFDDDDEEYDDIEYHDMQDKMLNKR